jgi:hypothetical protein
LLADPEGYPAGIEVFKGNTADAVAFKTPAGKVLKHSGPKELSLFRAPGRAG